MVKTRESTRVLYTLRSGNGRGKNIANRNGNELSSDESGLDSKPFPPETRRLRSSAEFDGGGYPNLKATVPLTRSTRRSARLFGDASELTYSVETRTHGGRATAGRGKGGRVSISSAQKKNKNSKKVFADKCELIRRSDRKRRKVYETLNVQMLTDHRFLTDFENSKPPKNSMERKRYFMEEESDSQTEGDEDALVRTPSMYDLVKRKHDQTPTPEKRSNRSSIHKQQDQREETDEEEDDEEEDDEEDDDEEDEDEDEDDGDGEEEKDYKGYQLRQRRPIPNRYIAPPLKTCSRGKRGTIHLPITKKREKRQKPPKYASPVRRMQRHKRKAINMSSSTSSSDESGNEKDERKFERRKSKSMAKARGRCLPMNFTMEDATCGIIKERARIGSSLADVDPMNINNKVMFDAVGGLNKQIRALKEMVLFPLMYPEVFEKFKVAPPRGVLFHGPPGTGKTLVARALANECSQGDKKVAFFMRKGADCLSKWVGESERQLRLLFDQAFTMRPSIIFFDEIDGLAPVRSSRQDQIHSSIVSTLLALMDGLDSRGEIVVIGATNRIDAIDPALRRPGRFDREFQFSLPDKNARRSILTIHTCEWEPKLLPSFVNELSGRCVGYCGADIKALCTEAALFALRRRYPQIYNSSKKLLLDVNSIEVTAKDFQKAMKTIVPASQRSVVSPARPLLPHMWPLLKKTVAQAVEILKNVFPPAHVKTVTEGSPCKLSTSSNNSRHENRTNTASFVSDEEGSSDDDYGPSIFEPVSGSSRSERYMRRVQQFSSNPVHETVIQHQSSFFCSASSQDRGALSIYRPRMLICGEKGMGQSAHLAPALLHTMEHMTVYCLDLPALFGVASKTPEEACAQLFREARRTSPCVVYSPHFDSIWNATGDSLHATLLSLLQDLPPLAPVLFLATVDKSWCNLPSIMQELFSEETGQVFLVEDPTFSERKCFFSDVLDKSLQLPKPKESKRDRDLEVLPFAPTPPPRQLSEAELSKARQDEENTMRELRIFLRDVHTKLITDRRFKEFSKPVDLLEVPDYLEVIKEPMDLATILHRIDCHYYNTCAQYLADVDLITSNALKYNPDRDPLDKLIRHRACELSDLAHSHIKSQLEPEFEKICEEIVSARERRGDKSTAAAPPYVLTAPVTQGTPTVVSVSHPKRTEKSAVEVSDITFVSESQPQSNTCTTQKRKAKKPRKKAPIYWGKKPSKRKPDAKRNLNIDSHLVKAEKDFLQNDGHSEGDRTEDVACNFVGVKSTVNDTRKGEESDANINEQCDIQNTQHDSHDVNTKEDEVETYRLFNGDGDLLHAKDPIEFCNDVISSTNTELISQLSDGNPKNSQTISTVNGIIEEDNPEGNTQDMNPHGDSNSNTVPEMELSRSSLNTSNKELDKLAGNSDDICSQVTDGMKEKLDFLLHLLVESTKGSCIETLERCYSALQFCIHQHRYCHDKAKLLQDLEQVIRGLRVSQRTTIS